MSQVNNNGSNSNNITMIDSSGMMSLSLHDVDEAFSDATINDENDDNGYYDYDNNHSNGDRDIENINNSCGNQSNNRFLHFN